MVGDERPTALLRGGRHPRLEVMVMLTTVLQVYLLTPFRTPGSYRYYDARGRGLLIVHET